MAKSKAKVIIIDDDFQKAIDPINGNKIIADPRFHTLKKYFENVVLKETPDKGVDYIKQHKIDRLIVLLDYKFGDDEQTGHWVLEEIRKISFVIPVILMTENDISFEEFPDFINDKIFSFVENKESAEEIVAKVKEADLELSTKVEVALEDWIDRHSPEDRDKPYLTMRSGETYTLNNVMQEIRLQTKFGQKMEKKILKLAIELLAKDIEKLA